MSWDTRDGWHGDDGHDPEADDGWRWCGVHGRPYYGRECSTCVLDETRAQEAA